MIHIFIIVTKFHFPVKMLMVIVHNCYCVNLSNFSSSYAAILRHLKEHETGRELVKLLGFPLFSHKNFSLCFLAKFTSYVSVLLGLLLSLLYYALELRQDLQST